MLFYLFNPIILTDNVDESFDEHDEDFNFMGAEEEIDLEEFRTDKGVVITRKFLILRRTKMEFQHIPVMTQIC